MKELLSFQSTKKMDPEKKKEVNSYVNIFFGERKAYVFFREFKWQTNWSFAMYSLLHPLHKVKFVLGCNR